MPETAQPTILIVDDDTLIGEVYSRNLELVGYRVLWAKNGADGLKMAIEEEPALILLDYFMPQMNGLEVLHKLRKEAWGNRAVVVFATNVYDLAVVNEALQYGVRDYIIKSDLSTPDLIKLVGKYVKPVPVA